jgi:hypothetical protein
MIPINRTETIDHTGDCQWCVAGPDTRVTEYALRAPMTYPVPFGLLPKWPPAARTHGLNQGNSRTKLPPRIDA